MITIYLQVTADLGEIEAHRGAETSTVTPTTSGADQELQFYTWLLAQWPPLYASKH